MQHISTDNITAMNELIYAGSKLVSNENGIPLRNPNRIIKPGWEMRQKGQIKQVWKAKLLCEVKQRNQMARKDPRKTTTDKSDNTTRRNKSKYIEQRRKTQKELGQGQTIFAK